jgi:hypothetical protein
VNAGGPALLADIVTVLTGVDRARVEQELTAAPGGDDAEALGAADFILRLLRQAPMGHTDRTALLDAMDRHWSGLVRDHRLPLIAARALLRSKPLRIPLAPGPVVQLPPLTPELSDVYGAILDLDEHVREPWTLIGGLMVLTHCAELGAPFPRPTRDADITVSVFTHREALRSLTMRLNQIGFRDVTPDPLAGGPRLSYRWSRSAAKVDVAVPPKANDQQRPPTTVSGRVGVELPATQQALRRTQRVAIALAGSPLAAGAQGHVRRPDLLRQHRHQGGCRDRGSP